jgi:hypothetical protein
VADDADELPALDLKIHRFEYNKIIAPRDTRKALF